MARLARPATVWSDDDDDDEFPDIGVLVRRKKTQAQDNPSHSATETGERPGGDEEPKKPATGIRRRKLGPLSDNLLLRAWTPDSTEDERQRCRDKENVEPRRTRVELRARKATPAAVAPPSPEDQEDDFVSAREEVSIVEEVSIADDTFHSCESEGSEFQDSDSEYRGSDDESDDIFGSSPPRRPPAKPRIQLREKKHSALDAEDRRCREPTTINQGRGLAPKGPIPESKPAKTRTGREKAKKEEGKGLADTLSRLQLGETEEKHGGVESAERHEQDATSPSTPPKPRAGLVSPRKLPRIPVTPHRPSSDMFWSQEFVDDWNDEHSPRKQLFPDAAAARQRSPSKSGPEKRAEKSANAKKRSQREAKKAFAEAKHGIAEKFLQELDTVITDGKLSELAASTGGIKIVWTNKLNTTAGRANWKREAVRRRGPDGAADPASTTTYRHHASIELAEKVIDDEHRLLNVLAHEFCHLANFMISGVTNNPHGREFRAWAAKCSRAFGDRGIEVTTKHSYDIDFKYVWQCVACGMEFKRHSKSIDPARHRCGSCRSELQQTKPVPRKKKGEDGAPAKVSEYQAFMKEQMRLVRAENPGSPQKEIMKIVASRWAQRSKASASSSASAPDGSVEEVAKDLGELSVQNDNL